TALDDGRLELVQQLRIRILDELDEARDDGLEVAVGKTVCDVANERCDQNLAAYGGRVDVCAPALRPRQQRFSMQALERCLNRAQGDAALRKPLQHGSRLERILADPNLTQYGDLEQAERRCLF